VGTGKSERGRARGERGSSGGVEKGGFYVGKRLDCQMREIHLMGTQKTGRRVTEE